MSLTRLQGVSRAAVQGSERPGASMGIKDQDVESGQSLLGAEAKVPRPQDEATWKFFHALFFVVRSLFCVLGCNILHSGVQYPGRVDLLTLLVSLLLDWGIHLRLWNGVLLLSLMGGRGVCQRTFLHHRQLRLPRRRHARSLDLHKRECLAAHEHHVQLGWLSPLRRGQHRLLSGSVRVVGPNWNSGISHL